MGDSKGLRLKPPSPLPQGPVTKIAFKVFVNQTKAYLEQDPVNYLFLQEGCYSEWRPRQEGQRLTALHATDPENVKLTQQANAGRDAGRIDLPAEQQRLLVLRNSQLSKFVTLIAILCYYTEQDDITECSTSFAWIEKYLRQCYNLESRGEHFLDIAEITYKTDMPYQSFYKQFRAGFLDNLRKRGDQLAYKNFMELPADETMTPTLEASIVMWALEKIDPRLPKKVKKNYGHQMVGHQCLMSLQPTIFQNIGAMLLELDETDNALAARCDVQQGECNFIRSRPRAKGSILTKKGTDNRGQYQQSHKKIMNKKPFCRICYHSGASPKVYSSHPISMCSYLTAADKADLRNIAADGPGHVDARQADYYAPGWDTGSNENESDEYESDLDCHEINNKSYFVSQCHNESRSQANSMYVQIGTITPVPSQILETTYNGSIVPVTLDSGATLSFIREDLAKSLNMRIQPNTQLATLADQETLIKAIGEIDVKLYIGSHMLRLRALVVEKLQSPCFGGTNFHVDNNIVTDIKQGTISIKGGYQIQQSNFGRYRQNTSLPSPPILSTTCDKTVQTKSRHSLLPDDHVDIPLKSDIMTGKIAVTPAFQGVDPDEWPCQICPIVEGSARYVNRGRRIIKCPKYAHFAVHKLTEVPNNDEKRLQTMHSPLAPLSIDNILRQFSINDAKMNQSQRAFLDIVHRKNVRVFDNDLTYGYNHKLGYYEVSFVFKDSSKPPPLKVWAPQYNKSCQDLLQAKCDQLEAQGVLKDPMDEGIDILHLSPIMIQQKGRAKHKKLQDCSLEEVRFISCQNVLNESIKPIPSTSTSQIKILKFLGRWRYHIFADMHNSYFQIPIKKDLWGYMAVTTPYRGIKILTRAGQGLLNSDVHLDQLMSKVLGDEISAGFAEVARDDIQVGGNSIDELLENWQKVLTKLNICNLKISPNKVRILMDDVEVYGVRIKDGHVMPSPHRISNLGDIDIENIKTVKQLNSWRGLFKTLIGHLPYLSFYMDPFDKIVGSKKSGDTLEWTPELIIAFKNAKSQLEKINKTYLPSPEDRLILKPDAAKINTCTGWVLYAVQCSQGKEKLLPVLYCSAKLPEYMGKWYPCEIEAVASVLAIDQSAHWINESIHPTIVMPDSMPVVKAANLMKQGRHSKNPRLQALLSCVNRRNIIFTHNSAKRGQHIIPDSLSRLNCNCDCGDCSVSRFLDEIPARSEIMNINVINSCTSSLTNLIWADSNRGIEAVTAGSVSDFLQADTGTIPFGNKRVWKDLQHEDLDCRAAIDMKKSGNIPSKKSKNRILNNLMKECTVNKQGLLVHTVFDDKVMRELEKIVVPQVYLHSVLTILHNKLMHPSSYQLSKVFGKYFFAPNVSKMIQTLRENCDVCIATSKLPKQLDEFKPNQIPQHPGSHMNVDIMCRSNQKIMVCTDMFSLFTTASFIPAETREQLEQALIRIITPIRHSSHILVRTDNAPAFKSLAKSNSQVLLQNGIVLELGQHANKNSNAIVDKMIQELENELRKIAPDGDQINEGKLGKAITVLNTKIRAQGLSSSELHFSRDPVRGINLHLNDKELADVKLTSRQKANSKRSCDTNELKERLKPSKGDMVVITNDYTKHKARDTHIVTGVDEDNIKVSKIVHSSRFHEKLPKWSPYSKVVNRKFITVSNKSPTLEPSIDLRRENPTISPTPTWIPGTQEEDSDSDWSEPDTDSREIAQDDPALPVNPITVQPENQTGSNTDTSDDTVTSDNRIDWDPIQDRGLVKGDRVTFFNELTLRWTIAKITSGPNKYYRNTGPYHNFQAENGDKGGHYFFPGGQWSILTDDHHQLSNNQEEGEVTFHNIEPFFIDDEYCDQEELSFSDTSQIETVAYPSAASFPGVDFEIVPPMFPRTRFRSASESDLPTQTCPNTISQKLRQWGSAMRSVWSSSDSVLLEEMTSRRDEGKRRRRAATPQ